MELSREQIQKLIELAGVDLHVGEIDKNHLSRLLVLIEQKMDFFTVPVELSIKNDLNVLVVDDLELSIYRFTKVLKKIGLTPSVARNKEEAIAEIKKQQFDYIVVDLYLPDLKDGIALIEETVKLREANEQKYKIILISSTSNNEIIESCYKKGIDHFVPKSENWHENILKYIAQNMHAGDSPNSNFNKFLVNNDIVVYSLNKINNKRYVEELLKDANLSLALGHKNLIINFEKIKVFDMENANLFSDLYKIAVSQGGRVIFVAPNEQITQTIDDIYLSGIVQISDSIDSAVASI